MSANNDANSAQRHARRVLIRIDDSSLENDDSSLENDDFRDRRQTVTAHAMTEDARRGVRYMTSATDTVEKVGEMMNFVFI